MNTKKYENKRKRKNVTIHNAKIQKRAKAFRRINLLKCLVGMKWGADEEMLLRVHKMMVLSVTHNKGLRIALIILALIAHIMCESGFESLAERRKRKNHKHGNSRSSHPVNRWFKEDESYEDYALKPKLSRPFFVRALGACSSLEVDLDMVESVRQLQHPPWI
jgi:hypothetical protein